jgi:hypothetical protein
MELSMFIDKYDELGLTGSQHEKSIDEQFNYGIYLSPTFDQSFKIIIHSILNSRNRNVQGQTLHTLGISALAD